MSVINFNEMFATGGDTKSDKQIKNTKLKRNTLNINFILNIFYATPQQKCTSENIVEMTQHK